MSSTTSTITCRRASGKEKNGKKKRRGRIATNEALLAPALSFDGMGCFDDFSLAPTPETIRDLETGIKEYKLFFVSDIQDRLSEARADLAVYKKCRNRHLVKMTKVKIKKLEEELKVYEGIINEQRMLIKRLQKQISRQNKEVALST